MKKLTKILVLVCCFAIVFSTMGHLFQKMLELHGTDLII